MAGDVDSAQGVATTTGPAESSEPPVRVDFWFDPTCPWAWITSRWMLEVAEVRPVELHWHVMSLGVLNEGRELSDRQREKLSRVMFPVRLVIAAEQQLGPEVVLPLYTAIGTRFHPEDRNTDTESQRQVLVEALAEVGLPANLIEAVDTDHLDDPIRTSHHAGMDPVGQEVGTPVLHVDGVAFFGPVMSVAPTGEEAGRLFDAVVTCAQFPGFFEFKRSRDSEPIFD